MFGDTHRLREHLRAHGQRADADVLEVKRRRWNVSHGGGVGVTGYSTAATKPVYKLKLRVNPSDGLAFEVEIIDQSLLVPQVGATVAVLFDPEHHSKVVLDLDEMDPFAALRRQSSQQTESSEEMTGADGPVTTAWVSGAEPKRVVFDSNHPDFLGVASADPIARLSKLADLRDRGAITDAQFEAEKAKILRDG